MTYERLDGVEAGAATLGALEERIAKLESLLAAQQRETTEQRQEMPHAPASQAPRATDAVPAQPASSAERAAAETEVATDERPGGRASRRALLKLGGVAAAAGVAAIAAGATELAHPDTVHAADGSNMIVGAINSSTSETVLENGSTSTQGTLAVLDMGVAGTLGYAWSTYSRSQAGIGVMGIAGNPVPQLTAQGNIAGVFGYSEGYNGLAGVSGIGSGVVGKSAASYGGAFQGGLAPAYLAPATTAGPPTTNTHYPGELFVDIHGILWYCAAYGLPGLWFRITGVVAGVPGGALNYLTAPIRIFDSRAGQPAPLPVSKGALAGGSTTAIQVTGTTVGGLGVPPGASGVFGNLTVTNTVNYGDLILFPHGAAQPLTSNINYGPGQTIANSFSVGLSADGKIDLYVHVSTTDVVIDIAGYVL